MEQSNIVAVEHKSPRSLRKVEGPIVPPALDFTSMNCSPMMYLPSSWENLNGDVRCDEGPSGTTQLCRSGQRAEEKCLSVRFHHIGSPSCDSCDGEETTMHDIYRRDWHDANLFAADMSPLSFLMNVSPPMKLRSPCPSARQMEGKKCTVTNVDIQALVNAVDNFRVAFEHSASRIESIEAKIDQMSDKLDAISLRSETSMNGRSGSQKLLRPNPAPVQVKEVVQDVFCPQFDKLKKDDCEAMICVPVKTSKDIREVDTWSVSTDDDVDFRGSFGSTVSLEQNSNVGSCRFISDGSTVTSSLDCRGSEQNSNVGSYRFLSDGSTVTSSLDGRGQEHMESLKSDVVPGTYKEKTDLWHSTHRCAEKSAHGDIPRLPFPVLRGPCQAVMPNFLNLHGSARVVTESTRLQNKILFTAPTRSQSDSLIVDSAPQSSRVRSAISQWEKMPIRSVIEIDNSGKWPFAVS